MLFASPFPFVYWVRSVGEMFNGSVEVTPSSRNYQMYRFVRTISQIPQKFSRSEDSITAKYIGI